MVTCYTANVDNRGWCIIISMWKLVDCIRKDDKDDGVFCCETLQYFTDRIHQLVQCKYMHLLRWKRFLQHTSVIESLYADFNKRLWCVTFCHFSEWVNWKIEISVVGEFISSLSLQWGFVFPTVLFFRLNQLPEWHVARLDQSLDKIFYSLEEKACKQIVVLLMWLNCSDWFGITHVLYCVVLSVVLLVANSTLTDNIRPYFCCYLQSLWKWGLGKISSKTWFWSMFLNQPITVVAVVMWLCVFGRNY